MNALPALDDDIRRLAEEFRDCRQLLVAVGDETRQHLIVETMLIGDCSGIRVGTIAERTHLSRPAVSHHIQILKAAGILKVRREGTRNYYYFDRDMAALDRLIALLRHIKTVMRQIPGSQPDGGGESEQEENSWI